jgi:hypothetical protein
MAETMTTLSEPILEQLQQQDKFVILNTIDSETGSITSSAISWITPHSPSKLRVAIDARSRLIANVKADKRVTLSLFAAGSFYAVQGTASVVQDRLEEVPIKLACLEIEVEAVRDAMYYGARVSALPEVEKTYDKRAADKLDAQVFAALQKA